jgi:hypothetical protein
MQPTSSPVRQGDRLGAARGIGLALALGIAFWLVVALLWHWS